MLSQRRQNVDRDRDGICALGKRVDCLLVRLHTGREDARMLGLTRVRLCEPRYKRGALLNEAFRAVDVRNDPVGADGGGKDGLSWRVDGFDCAWDQVTAQHRGGEREHLVACRELCD
jgi:hypothetical protein